MTSKLQKWGNSLALRIPKSYAKEVKLDEGSKVKIKIEKNSIIISPVMKKKRKKKYNLEEMISQITPENRYNEIDFGPSVGKETF